MLVKSLMKAFKQLQVEGKLHCSTKNKKNLKSICTIVVEDFVVAIRHYALRGSKDRESTQGF